MIIKLRAEGGGEELVRGKGGESMYKGRRERPESAKVGYGQIVRTRERCKS